MKPLVVQNQVKLGAARCFALCVAGMSYRLFRSMVTVAILALAVTFLSHVWSHSLLVHATQRLAWDRLRDTRQFGQWVLRLTDPDPVKTIREHLVTGQPDRLAEYQAWTDVDEATISRMRRTARDYADAVNFIENLPAASRAVITGGLDPRQALARLGNPEHLQRFRENLKNLGIAPPEGGVESLRVLVEQRLPKLQQWIDEVQAAQAQAIEQVKSTAGFENPRDWFAESPDNARSELRSAGFRIDDWQIDSVLAAAKQDRVYRLLDEALSRERIKRSLARKMDMRRRDLTTEKVLLWASSAANARWLEQTLAEADPQKQSPVTAEQMTRLADTVQRVTHLEAAAGETEPAEQVGLFSMPRATRWLVILSFLVCAVGVTNAMFMSVTERFTEIATMKCLGALDSFLMLLFLFESAIQGVAGALIGIILGLLLAFGRGLAGFGGLAIEATPVGSVLLIGGWSIVAGVVLAVVAAVGPAWMAARLAPMEAMRIE